MNKWDNFFSTFPSIQTERLFLRQIVAADAEDLYCFYNDAKFKQYLDWNGPSSIDECLNMIDFWNRSFEEKRVLPWGISTRNNDKLIGTIIIMPIRGTFEDAPRYPFTLAYDLEMEFWNKGFMTEALKAALNFCKKEPDVHRIQAEVLPENKASLRLLEKLGFHKEGLLNQYLMHESSKTFMNVILMALLCN
ncbi:GNAT family N-acetyltransferase [Aneurinibacillus uraniidurans]|uniref:GNAT family N-acetyltransferase n=1 Tax=Aneurinibacillus uraniidurans TaxID=2966586 RepID=UPI00234B94EE|nr:GNAT family N-acetyltransferase [Aneurinibacillus sp. B1]WCN37903.1 GNAT family N-acetyltransferase [Aneurinibacillus sp. B1]